MVLQGQLWVMGTVLGLQGQWWGYRDSSGVTGIVVRLQGQ